MLTLVHNADLYAPQARGLRDLLIGGGKILAIGDRGSLAPQGVDTDRIDAAGLRTVPGLIDPHAHPTGGGGESGPNSRVPPMQIGDLIGAGITTCVGLLGTDGTTRTMRDLVAQTLALRAEGISAYCYSGGYQFPPLTLTGNLRDDIIFVDPIIGAGELAISDHRSSQPTLDELLRVAADCHVAGLISGKAGVLHLHLGDGPRGLELVRRALDQTELPARTFYPTHVNRRHELFEESKRSSERGVTVDVTAVPDADGGLMAEDAIETWLDEGLPSDRLTCSSDGGGCLPVYDAQGELTKIDVGRPATLLSTLQALLARGRALETVLPVFTSNAARLLRLAGKGRIEVGGDADLLVLGANDEPHHLLARGRVMVRDGVTVVTGAFETGGRR